MVQSHKHMQIKKGQVNMLTNLSDQHSIDQVFYSIVGINKLFFFLPKDK
jgi:hypothetical protein